MHDMEINYKLANVLLRVEDFLEGHEKIYAHYSPKGEAGAIPSDADTATPIFRDGYLEFTGKINFLTYFNALSLAKWKRYTKITNVWLHVELSGADCTLSTVGVKEGHNKESTLSVPMQIKGTEQFQVVDIKLPFAESLVLISFMLQSTGSVRIKNAYFYTKIEEEAIEQVGLALCMTTFMREEYVLKNIELIKEQVLGSQEAIAEHMMLLVIDNGRSLSVDDIETENIRVFPNDNVGGSGGFARGMIEALRKEDEFTHVILMDDDVSVSPESFVRTYNLLSLVNIEYKDAFISGAMLVLEEPSRQYEDVSFVTGRGAYQGIKPNLFIDDLAQIVESETANLEVDNAYAAWWYCGIPLSAVKEKGLPLPFFVRCDDVDYGVRCGQKYMAMNGICVWHAGFEDRYNAAVDCYQFYRNFPITTVVNELDDEKIFFMRMMRNIRFQLRLMAYDAVELMLEGYEDYLKGPEFLAAANGEALIKQHGKRGEKLIPVEELDEAIMSKLEINYDSLGRKDEPSIFLKLWRTLPYDRHLLPDFLLKEKPASIFYSFATKPNPQSFACKTLVALDSTGKRGAIRHMDKERYRAIKKRIRSVKRNYRENNSKVKGSYRDAHPWLTSRDFWEKYLGL